MYDVSKSIQVKKCNIYSHFLPHLHADTLLVVYPPLRTELPILSCCYILPAHPLSAEVVDLYSKIYLVSSYGVNFIPVGSVGRDFPFSEDETISHSLVSY